MSAEDPPLRPWLPSRPTDIRGSTGWRPDDPELDPRGRERSPLRELSPPLAVWHRAKSFSTSNLFQHSLASQGGGTPSCQALKHAVSTLYRIDDFQLAKIGAGFFSEVFRVTHKTTGKIMVLKMNKHRSNRNNMLKEVQLMNKLNHPNILRFEAACVHEGQLHALTEFINGGSLEQVIQKRDEHLSWSVRISLALDIAKGLAYLHSKGFFHRDLTSKNVLIQRMAHSKLIAIVADFGLAAPIPQSTDRRLPQVGSPYWMSPECLRGKFYSQKTDTFSYGIINCELIGRLDADPDVLPRTENFGVDYIAFSAMCPDCPPQYLKITFSCVKIDPQSRPSAQDLVNDMSQLLDGQRSAETRDELRSLSHFEGRVTLRKVGHKRSLSVEEEQNLIRRNGSPSEKARFHYRTHFLTSPTPSVMSIGQEMSLRDPHYRPSILNPFTTLPRLREGRKILGSSQNQLFSSCFELPSPSRSSSPMGDMFEDPAPTHLGTAMASARSLPSSPTGSSENVMPSFEVAPRTSAEGETSMLSSHPVRSSYPLSLTQRQQDAAQHADHATPFLLGFPRPRGRGIPASSSASRFEDHLFQGRVQLLRRLYSGGNWMTQDDTAVEVNSDSLEASYYNSAYPLRRRGSCESGFCSVGTDELFLDSGLSSTRSLGSSLLTVSDLEEDLRAASAYLKRTSSVFTDSTDDLTSITPGGELADVGVSAIYPAYEKDIRDIVEYFEATCRMDVAECRRSKKSVLARSGVAQAGLRGVEPLTWSGRGQLVNATLAREEGRPVQLARSQKIDSLIKRVVEKESRGRLRHKLPTPQRLQVCDGIVRSKLPLFDCTKSQGRGWLPHDHRGIVKAKLAIFDQGGECGVPWASSASSSCVAPTGSPASSSKQMAERRLASIMASHNPASVREVLPSTHRNIS